MIGPAERWTTDSPRESIALLPGEPSWGEEIASGLSHALGLAAALTAAPLLIRQAAARGDVGFLIGTSLFVATAVLLYLVSTLYHFWPVGCVKRALQTIDHAAIFLLIAGTYTPFTLGVMRGPWGWLLLTLVWGLAAAGVTLKARNQLSHPWVSTGLYLCQGWLVLIVIYPAVYRIPTAGMLWLVAGGLAYTVGVVFYLIDTRVPYGHFIWHLFVLSGTACHAFAVAGYAAGIG